MDKNVFLFPHCMWGLGERGGWFKNPKQFLTIFIFGTTCFHLTLFLVPYCVKGRGVGGWAVGSTNLKLISDQFSCHFGQFGTSLFFSSIFHCPEFNFFVGGGSTNPELIADQFSRHFSQFGTTLTFFILTKLMFLGVGVNKYFFLPISSSWVNCSWWGVNKSENYFWLIFSPFPLIWDNFDLFLVEQKKSGWGSKKNLKIISDQFSGHFR